MTKLKILVLEDDPSKKARLLQFLGASELIEHVEACLCTDAAEKALREHSFDLFLVDIVVPRALGGSQHEENSIRLLEQLDDGVNELKQPSFILPLSESNELSDLAHEFFLGRPWGIVPYDNSSDDAIQTIQRVVEYVAKIKNQVPLVNQDCDVLIVTALLEPEFVAIQNLSFGWGAWEPLDKQHLMKRGEFQSGCVVKKVVAVLCQRMGPVQSAILVTKALALNPKIVVMGGICAGIPSKAGIGDVIAADVSWDWQSGKYIDKDGQEEFEISPHQLDIPDSLRSKLLQLKTDQSFWNSVAPKSQALSLPMPKLVIGPMATGSSVLADDRVVSRIREGQHKNVVGLDMETYGVYAAVQATSPSTFVISLKAVCDKGDKKKDDRYQAFAAEISSKAIEHFLLNLGEGIF